MAFGGSKLRSGASLVRKPAERTLSSCSLPPEPSRSSSASSETLPVEEDPDTIVVDVGHHRTQLPTPAESTIDVSSDVGHDARTQGSQVRHRRVDHRSDRRQQNRDRTMGTTLGGKDRSVSGETLVTSTSQSSLLRSGIAALDLPWSVTSLVSYGATADEDIPMQTGQTRIPHSEKDSLRAEKAAAKRAKVVENTKLWESRKREADKKATRRSSRAFMLDKAGETVSDLTTGMLGKRPREALNNGKDRLGDIKRRATLRRRSAVEPFISTNIAFEGPTAREKPLSDSNLGKFLGPTETLPVPRKPAPRRGDKKWLNSGLYTGQRRDFDGRLSESKNKRKHDAAPPIKENKTLPLPMFAGERIMKYGRDFKLPYDVFSPLPPGQPRPDEWRKTNKNVFVGEAAQVWRHSKPREQSTCMCTLDTGCLDNCMNRCMFYECDSGNCNLVECSNRSFQSLALRSKKGGKYNVGVEVIETRDRGFGVRSNRTFEPNQIIVEYTGEIITQDECDKRMRTLYKGNECYYLMLFDQNMIIDATRGSIARFVNHSCEPNCRMEKWTVGGKPRMALFAGDKGIMTGDELTYDYNFDPFSQKNVQQCRCGTSTCRGVLGPKPKDERKPKAERGLLTTTTSKLAGAKRKVAEILDEGADRWNKRLKVAGPGSTVTAIKKATATGSSSERPARARAGSSDNSNASKAAPSITLVKKPALRAVNLSVGAAVPRRPSILRRAMNGAKGRATTRRIVSNASASERLLQGEAEQPLTRKDGLTAKAASIRKNVVRAVRGAKASSEQNLRPIVLDARI